MSLNFHHRNREYRGWGYKGKHSGVYENFKILSFSELHFYGLIINEGSNDSDTFKYFLNELIKTRRNKF